VYAGISLQFLPLVQRFRRRDHRPKADDREPGMKKVDARRDMIDLVLTFVSVIPGRDSGRRPRVENPESSKPSPVITGFRVRLRSAAAPRNDANQDEPLVPQH